MLYVTEGRVAMVSVPTTARPARSKRRSSCGDDLMLFARRHKSRPSKAAFYRQMPDEFSENVAPVDAPVLNI
jgi:hypothetical protein